MKYLSSIKRKDILTLTGLVIAGFVWIRVDQFLIPESGPRFIAFILLTLILYYLQFAINRPLKIWHYANTIALLSFAFTLLAAIVIHLIISHDFSLKTVLISLIVLLVPYITGAIYLIVRNMNKIL